MASEGNAGNARQTTFSYIPAAALKRFADELGSGDAMSNKFLQINKDRVNSFIEKPSRPTGNMKSDISPAKRTLVPGIHEYDFTNQNTSTFLHLQKMPEFQSSLGARSRFGEGDGSFFDRWLNADTVTSKYLYDKDGFPIMRFSLNEVKAGYKRHIKEYKDNKTSGRDYYVKPYAERRLERLERYHRIHSYY